MALVDTIKTLAETEVEGTPYFVVDVVGGDRSRKIQVLLDGDEGISIEQCSKISRAISKVVDDEEFEADAFILEVSSPGADKPLKHIRQYAKHVGRSLEIETGETNITGKLTTVNEDSIVVEPTLTKKEKKEKKVAEPVEIQLSEIVKSPVVLSFK
jgi:ribosome maturation factor RimP